jgi:peptidoglycan/LPS O-acetylase OafA/YrhL
MKLSIRPAAASRGGERTSNQPVQIKKPARLDALTGLRSFAAVNIVLFHFSNPDWFGPLAPVINAGYASVSFFILLSGFVLGYNYNARARAGELETKRFYEARFTRLYPIYLLSLILAFKLLPIEWGSHTHPMFWTGVVLSPLLLQGWIPEIATFLNTPAWTMSSEAFYYVLFPWMARWKKPERTSVHLAKMGIVWLLGLVPGTLYLIYNPDGLTHIDRFSYGKWLQALKYTPIPHLASFIFGVLLAELDEVVPRMGMRRLVVGLFGFVSTFIILTQAHRLPYALLHDGFFMPFFGCIVIGLAGINPLSKLFGLAPLVFVGEASYCLYLLHFNLWNMIHDSHVLNRLGLARFDPWISYVLLIGLALLALHFIEKPAQRILRNWMHVWR